MSHGIEKNDTMFSVIERPWHGLGTILEDNPTAEVAKVASGLDWDADFRAVQTSDGITIPGHRSIIRTDNNNPLGIVGKDYHIYQNSEMWDFIETLTQKTNMVIETAGSLFNGKQTWVLLKRDTFEPAPGDPVEQFFMLRNGFDGRTALTLLDTGIRVVCNNTLTAAIRGSKNLHNIRHTKTITAQVKMVESILAKSHDYQEKVNASMAAMFSKKLTSDKIVDIVENSIFPAPTDETKPAIPKNVISMEDKVKKSMAGMFGKTVEEIYQPVEQPKGRAATLRNNKIEKVLDLVESGAGTEIPGVKGTAWGLYNACTEYSDHYSNLRLVGDTTEAEARFNNATSHKGSGATFKQHAFKTVMDVVKSA